MRRHVLTARAQKSITNIRPRSEIGRFVERSHYFRWTDFNRKRKWRHPVGRNGVDRVTGGGEFLGLVMRRESVPVARDRRRRGGSDGRRDWASRRGRRLGRRRPSASSLRMTAPPRSILVVRMVGQMLYPQTLRFLDKRPLVSQRQLTPIMTCNKTPVLIARWVWVRYTLRAGVINNFHCQFMKTERGLAQLFIKKTHGKTSSATLIDCVATV